MDVLGDDLVKQLRLPSSKPASDPRSFDDLDVPQVSIVDVQEISFIEKYKDLAGMSLGCSADFNLLHGVCSTIHHDPHFLLQRTKYRLGFCVNDESLCVCLLRPCFDVPVDEALNVLINFSDHRNYLR